MAGFQTFLSQLAFIFLGQSFRPILLLSMIYLQRGQHPVDAIFVAAAAAVPNIATNAAASPNSFIFIVISNRIR